MIKKYPFVVIGAGAAGLVTCLGLAKAGKKVLLIERGHFGGDCTNFGCIPSKALISSGKIAHYIKTAKDFGIKVENPLFTSNQSLDRTRRIIEEVKKTEDKEALEKQGVEVLVGKATFISPCLLSVETKTGNIEIEAKKIILATGSSPKKPSIEGIESVDYLTNETVFDLKEVPKSLIVIGGGPIGSELAQTFNRLGTKVFHIHSHARLLTRESNRTAELLEKIFLEEKIDLFLNYKTDKIVKSPNGVILTITHKDTHQVQTIEAEKILVAAGRAPNIFSLNLEKAKINYTEKGITTNAYKKTSQKHIYALGDCAGPPFFTHLAEYHARGVLQSLILFPKKIDDQPIPRVTYTDPEIASIGITEEEMDKKKMELYILPFSKIDRAVCEGREEGFISIITKKWSSKILGATIMGPSAGEMLMEISTAMYFNIPLRKLNKVIHAYPIYCRGIRKESDLYLTQTLLPALKKVFKK